MTLVALSGALPDEHRARRTPRAAGEPVRSSTSQDCAVRSSQRPIARPPQRVEYWHILVLAMVLGIASAFDQRMPEAVPR
jgi:hypothetical protein